VLYRLNDTLDTRILDFEGNLPPTHQSRAGEPAQADAVRRIVEGRATC
jgi:hypothetical protein